jgi:hypothetical protein
MPRTGSSICLACGTPTAVCLQQVGSLRCHDCRAANAPLRAEFVEPKAKR